MKKPWYANNPVIAHAAGGINQFAYTNSKEALIQSLENGERVIEMDFVLTTDRKLVCRHGWKDDDGNRIKKQTYDEFMATETSGGYTPLSAEDAISILKEYPKTYLVVDTQHKKSGKVYKRIKKTCKKLDCMDLLDRVIPQIYQKSEHDMLQQIYPFKNWIYSVYKEDLQTNQDYEKIANFCQTNNIAVVTIEQERITKERMDIFKQHNIVCYAHTINDVAVYNQLRDLGVYGIYSDFLTKSDLTK